MHYKNGREAKIGDEIVVQQDWEPRFVSGVVVGAYPTADTCNLLIVPNGTYRVNVTASMALHVEDAALMLRGQPEKSDS